MAEAQQILSIQPETAENQARYLLSAEPRRVPGEDPVAMAQVLDLNSKRLLPPFNRDALLSRGYWQPYEGEQSILPALLEQVRVVVPHRRDQ